MPEVDSPRRGARRFPPLVLALVLAALLATGVAASSGAVDVGAAKAQPAHHQSHATSPTRAETTVHTLATSLWAVVLLLLVLASLASTLVRSGREQWSFDPLRRSGTSWRGPPSLI